MKICRIIYSYAPYQLGGGDIYTEKISKNLIKAGHQEVIITISPNGGESLEEYENLKIYRFYPANINTFHNIGRKSIWKQGIWTVLDLYSFFSYFKIRNILRKEKPDVVHLHTPIDVTLSAIDAIRTLGLPLVLTLHDYLLLCRRVVLIHGSGQICSNTNINFLCNIYRSFCKAIISDKVDIVIAPSKFVLDFHKNHGFFKSAKKVILPHGIEINTDNITFDSQKGNIDKKKTIKILYVGGLTMHKGIHILISAVKQLKDKNFELHIAGNGAYEEKLKQLAGDDNSIIFHGKLLNEDMPKFYALGDVTVVPSIWFDVRPNVIPEAFRAKIPVIGSNIGGIPELIRDNYNGFLFEAGNIKQLTNILENVITKPEILKELGDNAYQTVKQFEMSKYIDNLIGIYHEAIEINSKRKCAE